MAPEEERTRWQSQRMSRPGNADSQALQVAEPSEVIQAESANREVEYTIWEFQDYGAWWCAMPEKYNDILEEAWLANKDEVEAQVLDIWHTEDTYVWDLKKWTQIRMRASGAVKVRAIRRAIVSVRGRSE